MVSRVLDSATRVLGSESACRLRRVLRGVTTGYGFAATCVVGAAFWILAPGFFSSHAVATTGTPLSASRTQHDGLPDAAAVVEAFQRARRWVDSFNPPSFDDPAARLTIENATGICIILRSAGRVVGTGTAVIGTDSQPDLLLRRAVGRALADVLGDPAVAALPEERRGEIGLGLTLEVEIAGQLQPLLGRDFPRIAQQIEPGLEGAALRRGELRAMLFPSQLRAVNAAGNIQSRLPGLATELGLTPADLATLQRRQSVSAHRFRTTHLAQEAPARFPFETFRGDRLLHLHEVTNESIVELADGLATHLIGRLWDRSPGADEAAQQDEQNSTTHRLIAPPSQERRLALGMRGDYEPAGDTYRPIVAPPLDQALSALALMRYSAAPGVNAMTARGARDAAVAVLVDLETVEEGEIDPLIDPAACAAIVMVLAEHPDLAREDEAIERLGRAATEVVVGSFDRVSGYWRDGRPLPPHAQALLAAALAQRLTHPDADLEPNDLDHARAAIDAAWASVPEQQHVSLLPWIGWAELAYAKASRETIANVEALRQVRATLEEARLLASADFEPDLAGGFPLAVGDASGGSRPTAQTSRPGAFFATMLREADLTPDDERAAAFERHRETIRFFLQLSVRESATTWSGRNPAAAVGGVRSSAWDSRMPTAAQALTLLAAVETLIAARGAD